MSRIRVLRGQCRTFQFDGAINVVQDDTRFNHGFRVKKFVISYEFPYDSGAGSRDCYGTLATHAEALPSPFLAGVVQWNWADRRQVAWTSTNMIGDSNVEFLPNLVDPTHVVVRDLYLGITAATATGSTTFNYYIELEELPLTDNEAVMAIIQEESQDVN
jgi:hypothetical protein